MTDHPADATPRLDQAALERIEEGLRMAKRLDDFLLFSDVEALLAAAEREKRLDDEMGDHYIAYEDCARERDEARARAERREAALREALEVAAGVERTERPMVTALDHIEDLIEAALAPAAGQQQEGEVIEPIDDIASNLAFNDPMDAALREIERLFPDYVQIQLIVHKALAPAAGQQGEV
jgi:hypothetical protein